MQEMFHVHSTLRDPRVQQSGYEMFKLKMMRSSFHLTQTRTCRERILMVVNGIASVSIMMSLIILGFSMDLQPGWVGWTVLEVIFAVVFVIEVVVKLVLLSPRVYFTGTNYAWNIGDLMLTGVAVVDVIISTTASTAGSARMSMVLRGLRLSRVARLIKLMNLPLLAELANMISAMVIGVPWLFWVTILLSGVLYICGIVLRSTVSNASAEMSDRCGDPDLFQFNHTGEDGCNVAYMYGEEYCGTVLKCMFTVFRCIIGDCNTKGGRPLAAIFSYFYGWRFEWFYGLSMVCMIFGMTNIITVPSLQYHTARAALLPTHGLELLGVLAEAMFVDATLSGLKYNDVLALQILLIGHETNYVTRKLNDLVEFGVRPRWLDRLTLDLDIELEARPGIFEAFGADADGQLSVSELVSLG
ncbi:Calcium-channel protein cch1 [Durusdinium trenchii]|uniref:Calcium-channel protein cch1 n=1 Tax=Durusdinium trenchii TaxID=1381693 RepID=A0ABP0S1X7_9DINO